ncbi:hypothetical protein CIHG_07261 [Coccidioides immitis H538.4]|uniref:Uncharacterized protein n=1 Tax=Coccidioides immitis H538.4 TaxID=396776 RepID=A0A0J8RZ57_COCIT|nr:hypothetical protein CIHG_07261 [Coccidioides immitis H538.4]
MASAVNRIFKGRKTSYRLLEVLKEPSAYKAAIIPSSLLAFSRILVLAAKPYCSQGRTMGRTEFERRVDYVAMRRGSMNSRGGRCEVTSRQPAATPSRTGGAKPQQAAPNLNGAALVSVGRGAQKRPRRRKSKFSFTKRGFRQILCLGFRASPQNNLPPVHQLSLKGRGPHTNLSLFFR